MPAHAWHGVCISAVPIKRDPGTTAHSRGAPPLGNGREDSLSDETLGRLSRAEGPESQGAYAGDDYGAVEPPEPADELEAQDERLRDDWAVRDDILDLLAAALPIRDLRVEVMRGRVTLDGVVPDRSMPGIAEDLTSRVPGVVEVVPRLSIEPS